MMQETEEKRFLTDPNMMPDTFGGLTKKEWADKIESERRLLRTSKEKEIKKRIERGKKMQKTLFDEKDGKLVEAEFQSK